MALAACLLNDARERPNGTAARVNQTPRRGGRGLQLERSELLEKDAFRYRFKINAAAWMAARAKDTLNGGASLAIS